ncbi:MAG: DUF1365 domain-containing protein [Minwuia sp.]|nr:DUF1365 domain-containing protein [Minwuia sp.]
MTLVPTAEERPAGSIYAGHVVHVRHRPKRHRLSYRVFTLGLDIDRLDELDRDLRLFGNERAAVLSLRAADHGPKDGGTGLRPWVEGLLRDIGLDAPVTIEMLTYPRLFGYVFNPLTVYFCRDADRLLHAIVYEVHNTFGDRHAYAIPVQPGETESLVMQQAEKRFFVSPFIENEGNYRFRVRPPEDDVAVVIRHSTAEGPLLDASFTGTRHPLTDRQILATVLRHPLMTHKVTFGIHWEAARLWLKGIPFLGRPASSWRA